MGDADPVFPASWTHGAEDCSRRQPPLQAHQLSPGLFILRQDKCSSAEGPFLYLLVGRERALLFDTGDRPVRGDVPLRQVVDGVLDGRSRPLIVAHSHSHTDHVFGDRDFTIRPDTVVVGTRRSDVEAFFGFEDWPRRTATVDLGDRPLTVIPIPGHEGSHIALYDHHSAVLFTGDTLYPGLLTIRDWDAYRASIARLVTFSEGHPISWILGGHVEMTHTPRTYYPLGTTYQPEEHPLHLSVAALYELQAACVRLGVRPAIEIHDDFVVYPLEGVATGVSDLDPDCCHPVTV